MGRESFERPKPPPLTIIRAVNAIRLCSAGWRTLRSLRGRGAANRWHFKFLHLLCPWPTLLGTLIPRIEHNREIAEADHRTWGQRDLARDPFIVNKRSIGRPNIDQHPNPIAPLDLGVRR
jgi:hypothetical protein